MILFPNRIYSFASI